MWYRLYGILEKEQFHFQLSAYSGATTEYENSDFELEESKLSQVVIVPEKNLHVRRDFTCTVFALWTSSPFENMVHKMIALLKVLNTQKPRNIIWILSFKNYINLILMEN